MKGVFGNSGCLGGDLGTSVSSEEAEALLDKWEESEHHARVWRTKRLYSSMRKGAFVSSSLAHAYFEEARVCWICGAYVSTILMTQLAFEEELRSHYRVARGVRGTLDGKVAVDQASFNQLIHQAEVEGWISRIQAKALHRIRKSLRNPYVHTKDSEKIGERGRRQRGFERKSDFFAQTMKIHAPSFETGSVVGEAQEAIKALLKHFPRVASQLNSYKYSEGL